MRSGPFLKGLLLLIPALLAGHSGQSQQAFDLDTSFRAGVETKYVSSIQPLPDGRIFLSGQIHFPGDQIGSFRGGAMLLSDGSRDMSFPNFPYTTGSGKITPWNGLYYVDAGHTVRRLGADCLIDPSFISMNLGPYFSSFQGGGYHVYPDGRILMSGVHTLYDSIRGFEGPHCLIWFSNTGYLDTTRYHRTCAGSLDFFRELPDGKFIGSLGNPPNTASWEDEPTGSNVIRFDADGQWDPTFQANVWWGTACVFLPLADGRVYVGGQFRIDGLQDTLNLVRLMPDGSLDPAFNNTLRYREWNPLYPIDPPYGIVRTIHPLPDGRLIVTGNFSYVDGEAHGCIALIDTAGNLLDDYFEEGGCSAYYYQPTPFHTPVYSKVISGISTAPDGSFYIWGAYHGYDDGTTNDTLQRMVSRLHGLNVGVQENDHIAFSLYPNPATTFATLQVEQLPVSAELVMRDVLGRLVRRQRVLSHYTDLELQDLRTGVFMIELLANGKRIGATRLVVQR